MANKFYAVKKGKCRGIFLSWEDCKKQIDGMPYVAYKSFTSLLEAAEYLEVPINYGEQDENSDSDGDEQAVKENVDNSKNIPKVRAYVDGSYNVKTKEFSYGMIILGVEKPYCTGEKFDDTDLATMRNVAGEIKGAEAAMKYALNHNIKEIAIYYDYEGIAKWCLGQWKRNKDGTKAYKAFYDKVKEKVDVTFIKVEAHKKNGDVHNELNEHVDHVAKQMVGLWTGEPYEIQDPPR